MTNQILRGIDSVPWLRILSYRPLESPFKAEMGLAILPNAEILPGTDMEVENGPLQFSTSIFVPPKKDIC